MNKRKILIIIGVCIFSVLIVIGTTYAYYRGTIFNDFNASTITHGLDYYINYTKGKDIDSSTLIMSADYTGGVSTEVELWKKDDTYDIYGHIYVDINEIGEALSTSNALNYVVLNNNEIIEDGILLNNVQNNSVLLTANIPLKTNKELYKIYIWLDQEKVVDNSIEDNILSLAVRCEATMKPIIGGSPVNYVRALYLSGNPTLMTQENSGDSYYYASSVNLMNDGMDTVGNWTDGVDTGNIRYYGSKPNNYIDIGDTELDSEGNEITTLYRIIGVFKDIELEDGTKKDLVKVVRNSSIGGYSFDNKNAIGSASNIGGSSNWSDARLMMLLNPGYENGFTNAKGQVIYGFEGSLYWNSKSGTCYSGTNNATKDCDFTSIGLSEETHSKIETVLWYLGASNVDLYPKIMYQNERGDFKVSDSHDLQLVGEISLMYPSDYGFATDLNSCSFTLYNYNEKECTKNNWLYVYNRNDWYITPMRGEVNRVNYLSADGGVSNTGLGIACVETYSVLPTFYLKDSVKIIGGKGTQGEPFIIN